MHFSFRKLVNSLKAKIVYDCDIVVAISISDKATLLKISFLALNECYNSIIIYHVENFHIAFALHAKHLNYLTKLKRRRNLTFNLTVREDAAKHNARPVNGRKN